MERTLPEKMLQKFQNGMQQLPTFENEEEEKLFLQFQKYNLLYVTPEGIFKTTRRGQEALKGKVEKYLFFERLEERLIRDSFRKRTEQKIILFVVIPMILLLTISFGIYTFCRP